MNDKALETLWKRFSDIPINKDEAVELRFEDWPKGTDRYNIWHWFDEAHSKGLQYLMYDMEK